MEEVRDTLCVYCTKACNGSCSWSEKLVPVDGWKAEKTVHGYEVVRCPQFVEETKQNKNKNLDKYGTMLLLEAIGNQMREDYIHGIGQYNAKKDMPEEEKQKHMTNVEIRARNRKVIEKWILGKGRHLLNLADPETVIKHLRKMARVYEQSLL